MTHARQTRFPREWTTHELAHVRSRAGKASAEAIGRELGRTPVAVRKFALRQGIDLHRYGEQHPNAKVSNAQVRAIRDMAGRGVRQVVVARLVGTSPEFVSSLVLRKRRA